MISLDILYSGRRRFSASMFITENRRLLIKVPQSFPAQKIFDLITEHPNFLQKSLVVQSISHQWPIKNGTDIFIFGRKIPIHFTNNPTALTLNTFFLKTKKATITQKEFYSLISPFLLQHILLSIKRFQQIMSIDKVGTVRMKLVNSQWGSCTLHGNLSFSKRLIHYPADAIEYVVIHELAHIFEHNHRSNFWAIVEKYCPDFKKEKALLRSRRFG